MNPYTLTWMPAIAYAFIMLGLERLKVPRMDLQDQPTTRHDTIRVLIANLSGTVSEAVEQLIRDQPDMVLVDSVGNPVQIMLAARRGADILVLGAANSSPAPGICSNLLQEFPHLKIIVISTLDGTAAAYYLSVKQQPLAALVPGVLLDEIRELYDLNTTL